MIKTNNSRNFLFWQGIILMAGVISLYIAQNHQTQADGIAIF
ncbi:hypothetical protein [Moraxella cuniculi]|nr:hypothetical protein [Moraxella cuniculi]